MTFFWAGLALLVTIAMAFIYQLLLEWIPFIYVSFLLTLALGTAIGMMTAFAVRSGHCRNVAIAGLIGVGLATAGLGAKFLFQYPMWVNNETSIYMTDNQIPETDREKIRSEIYEGVSFVDHLNLRTQQGWSIGRGGMPIQGIFVYAVWLIEAGMVFYFAWTLPVAEARKPYSEKTGQWASEAAVVMTLPITSDEMVSKIMQATDVDQLLEIPIPENDRSNRFAVYTVNSIPGQEMEDAYLSVTLLEYSVNNKGEQETKETPLVKHAILSSAKRQQLVDNADLLQEALADYRASLQESSAETEPE